MIEDIVGVEIKKLARHSDDRGFFTEVLKSDDAFFKHIKQTSYTETYPGVIKAFHHHEKQDDIWFVAKGMAQVVLYDLRKDSKTKGKTQVIYAGEDNPLLIKIPTKVAHGYKVLGNKKVCLFYHTTEAYNSKNPDEHRIPYDSKEVGFDWSTKNK